MCGELISNTSIDGCKQCEAGEHKRCAAYKTVTGMSLVKNGSTEMSEKMSEKDPKNVCNSYFNIFQMVQASQQLHCRAKHTAGFPQVNRAGHPMVPEGIPWSHGRLSPPHLAERKSVRL